MFLQKVDWTLRIMGSMEAGSSSSISSSKFKVGDTVSILRHGKATVTTDIVQDPQHEWFGRYQVSSDNSCEAVSYGRLNSQHLAVRKRSRLHVF
jgi:hypothetical protein